MNKLVKLLLFYWLIIVLLFLLTGCTMNKEEENKEELKTTAEINYIDDTIIKILNKYAKGEYFENDAVNWEGIINDEKALLVSLDTIILDLSELKIKNEDITKLSSEINNLIILTNEENEVGMISKLKDIYSLIPEYLASFEKDENIINKKRIKYLIVSVYDLANQGKWEEANAEILNLENKYKEMMNDINYAENNSYNLNNVYVLIEEFKNAINLENSKLINLKYINLIETI